MARNQKIYEELSLSDDFMFGKIMRNPDNCKKMLERLLNIKISRIEYPEDQKSIDIARDSRSVDGVTKIFFNTEGTIGDISDEAKAFLRYMGGSQSEDDFVRYLDDQVKRARENMEWRREFMTLEMKYQESREEGREEIRVEIAKTMLEDGMDLKIIAKYSGLTVEEIEELAQLQPV